MTNVSSIASDADNLIPQAISDRPSVRPQNMDGLQYLRAIAASLVVFFHASVQIEANGSRLPIFSFAGIGDKGVELFFVLSGFIIFYVHWNDKHTLPSAGNYAWKRLTRIIPTTFVVATAWFLVLVLMARIGQGSDNVGSLDFRRWASSALVLPMLERPTPIVIWTLKHELIFYGLFASFYIWRWLAVIVSLLWAACSLAFSGPSTDQLLFTLWSNYNVLFAVGMGCFFLHRTPWFPMMPRWSPILTLTAFLLCAAYFRGYSSHDGFLVLLFGVIAAAVLLTFCQFRLEGVSGRVGKFLGDASFSLYLVHFPALAIIYRLTSKLTDEPNLLFLLNVSGAMAAGLIFYVVVEKRITRAIQRLRPAPSRSMPA